MTDSGYYPIGEEHNSNAPWNQEETERVIVNETIEVWLNEEQQISVFFELSVDDNGDELTVEILRFNAKIFLPNWNDDIKIHMEEKHPNKSIKLISYGG